MCTKFGLLIYTNIISKESDGRQKSYNNLYISNVL